MSRSVELPGNVLSASELLKHKGISCIAWKEYDRANNVLPKSGQKQFEPNGSRLQNMQIEKGLSNRKELLSIERVDRVSQLAIAEWLPLQKKARVKKYSGQDWSSFGMEKNGALYLIPEEALFLLEANCLELLWNDIPLSVQQAYELLIDNDECSIEEYRVYSQLVRYGYKIQRYVYQYTEKEENNAKRKVIIDPNNGLRMNENQQLDNTYLKKSKNQTIVNSANNLAQNAGNNVNENVKQVLEDLLVSVEHLINKNMECPMQDHSVEKAGSHKRPSKIEIISDEPLRGDVRIIHQKSTSCTQDIQTANQRGWRIQRNVKLVPKRLDKPSSSDVALVDSNTKSSNSHLLEKRSSSSNSDHETSEKKPRHEVIELSDDEIQELPKPVSKKELLDTMPNIASQRVVEVKIQRRYIPYNIRPRKDVYYYNTNKLRNIRERGKYAQQRYNNHYCHHTPCNQCNRTPNWNPNPYLSTMFMNTNIYTSFMQRTPFLSGPIMNFGLFYFFNRFESRHPYPYERNRYSNHYRGNRRPNRQPPNNEDVYNPSFKIIPGTSSWSELKAKWREEKTITIDDEENTVPICRDNPDSEVQVVEECTNALIGPNNASSLAKIFEKLKIIKSAPEKTVRRKRGRYKISYNIYSNTQHYTKANPGPPLYRVVVKGQKDDQLVQPIELHRLLRDADDSPIVIACVSMSISYIQPGFVTVPDAT